MQLKEQTNVALTREGTERYSLVLYSVLFRTLGSGVCKAQKIVLNTSSGIYREEILEDGWNQQKLLRITSGVVVVTYNNMQDTSRT